MFRQIKQIRNKQIDIDKAAILSVVMNTVEIVVLLALVLVDLFGVLKNNVYIWRPMLFLAVGVLIVEALLSIRDAFILRSTNRQYEMLKDALGQLDGLNNQLRMQRHDFMNNLQVVYSLVDMGENKDAVAYMEQIYGKMKALSAVMKTAKPAVNALLQAKLGDAKTRGIQAELVVGSDWKNLMMNDWELCRVLGNIIDNAMDAMKDIQDKRLTIELFEDLRSFGFRITNNGPMIPVAQQQSIFTLGFTTKSTGQGLGLHIVKELLEENGGHIELRSDESATCFTGVLPRTADTAA